MKIHKFILLLSFLYLSFSGSLSAQTFNELVNQYRELQKESKYEEMIKVLDVMLKKFPDTQPEITYYNRGNTHRQMKEYKKSIEDYTKAIDKNPEYISAYNNRAISYFDLEEYALSVKDYSKVIESKPGNAVAYYSRGNAYSQLFDYDNAVKDYSKAIEIQPDFADAYYNRGNKYFGMSMYEEAKSDWEKAVKLNKEYEKELKDKIKEAQEKIERK
ncbi:MAG: tetratricopeptide repeat protein [Ignavibacteriae bacterium]|nr:tetratricopeptide repeat protein [Ignavibacteriota bacterium]